MRRTPDSELPVSPHLHVSTDQSSSRPGLSQNYSDLQTAPRHWPYRQVRNENSQEGSCRGELPRSLTAPLLGAAFEPSFPASPPTTAPAQPEGYGLTFPPGREGKASNPISELSLNPNVYPRFSHHYLGPGIYCLL